MQSPALRSDTDPVVAANGSQVAAPGGGGCLRSPRSCPVRDRNGLGQGHEAAPGSPQEPPQPSRPANACPRATNGHQRPPARRPSRAPRPLPRHPRPASCASRPRPSPPPPPPRPGRRLAAGSRRGRQRPPVGPAPSAAPPRPAPPAGFTRWPRAAGRAVGQRERGR